MCSFTKKLQLLGDFVPQTPNRGSARGPLLRDFRPQTSSPPLCPPNNPVRSTPLQTDIIRLLYSVGAAMQCNNEYIAADLKTAFMTLASDDIDVE